MQVQFDIEGERVTIDVEGTITYGDERILLAEDDDLTAGRPWEGGGYTVAPFLDPNEFRALQDGTRRLIHALLVDAGYRGPETELTRLHEVAAEFPECYAAMIETVRKCFETSLFPIDTRLVESRISEICGKPLTAFSPSLAASVFCLRVTRPHSNDNNPLHRDVWLDRLRNAVNIYVPLAGSNEGSSLPIVPGSHRWKESDIERTASGALVNGVAFTVPAVTGARKELRAIRPNPRENEVLVFSPYLIHGGAVNLNPDMTRVSLEMRFWRQGGGVRLADAEPQSTQAGPPASADYTAASEPIADTNS
ncbi:MAG TPA: phytanoyl-CoA dioxygenase family protein [Candidatus Binatia bacterium]|nr:phytanoyl-CoA dioxygenase family protein [Candidatus Binatia bacterium]